MPKINVSNIAIDSQTKEILKAHAEKKETSVGKVVKNLVEKYLVVDNDVIPVMIKIPANLRGNQSGLEKWLEIKISAIVKALSVK